MHRLLPFFLLVALATSVFAQDRTNARSMVISPYGIVATSQVQASQAGAEILSRGGSAVDAAIAANAVLGVMEPDMNGMGGDLFAIYWDAKTGKLYGLNSSGWAPKALTIAHIKAMDATQMPSTGIDSVTVPGAVEGWNKLHERFGRLPWKDLFAPAIFYAENGFAVPELISTDWDGSTAKLKSDPETARVFLVNGEPPKMGEVFKNPDVAKALTILAAEGPQAYYSGDIAKAILATEREHNGTMQADDLKDFSAEWVDPISTTYRGWKVYELPPNGQGMAALEMLNIMEQFEPAKSGPLSVEELQTRIEAMKLAYADLARYNADPRFAKVPVAGLISKEYAKQRAQLINPQKADCDTERRQSARRATPLTSPRSIATATSSRSSRATSQVSDRALPCAAWDSSCKIAARYSCSTRRSPTRSPRASVPSTPSFPRSWSAATTTLDSASWAAPTSRLPTRNSFRTSSTTA